MDVFNGSLFVFLLQINFLHSLYITENTDSLHQVLSEFRIIRPIRTNSEGRFLSASVTAHRLHRSKRHAQSSQATPTDVNSHRNERRMSAASLRDTLLMETPKNKQNPPTETSPPDRIKGSWRGRGYREKEIELFYNVTVFGRELHLRLWPNWHLVAPAATIEWWEESGQKHSQQIGDAGCFYTGEVSNMEDTSVAISNCDGLAGMIRMCQEEYFIEPFDRLRAAGEGDEEEEEGGRQHIIYRSSAVIARKQQAVNQTADDVLPGPLLGSFILNQETSGSKSARRRRYIEEAELFNIEVLLAVDYSVLLFHSQEHIQKYLLTLMNIVNEIYQDHSLGANINIVLVRIIILSPAKSQELISVGNPQKSLENVCGWSYLQQREQSHAEQHDLTIYLTRQEFGPSGMQGYAPVTGMCHLHRSCVLVFEDGFSSAFVAAHETGHVLGMEHDGEANDCEDDVSFGSIMSPRVQATFHRYHWSQCSWRELHKYLHLYDCLRDDPFNHDWPAQPQLPGFQYSMDQQCRFDFGPGYSICTTYATIDPCKQLWCSDYNNPFYCKTKKGPPLDGTKCGPGKHCFKGFCRKLTPDLLRQDGSWGTWSSYGICSRTCGGGVRFRTRRCDNPTPANGGRSCFGNSFEFQLCSRDECLPLSDFRADQCEVWNEYFEHEGKKHQWLPTEHNNPDERCRLFCQSKETLTVVSMKRMVHDGTLCSYSDAHSVCVRGECEHVGCDGQIASDRQEDRCGVCGGDNSSCKIIKGNFTRSTKKEGYLKILEIPRGARHLLVQELKKTPHILAVKNQQTGHLFLNDEDDFPESRVVIEKGVAWEYSNSEEQEYIQTTGPLKYGVLLMVRSHGEAKVTVSYKYIIHDGLLSSVDSNLVQEDTIFYEWALKKWSQCSKPCGGGKQYTRFGCRRKADGKMLHRMYCSNIHKPRSISRNCNPDACRSPRWVSGAWNDCSASCGQTGWQRRWVSCLQPSSRGKQHSLNSKLCGDQRPDTKQPCNRFPCPAVWRSGPWTPCSVSCGNGTQERQIACFRPEGYAGNCSQTPPMTTRTCRAPLCGGDQRNFIIQWLSRSNADVTTKNSSRQRCRGDRSAFCRMEALSRYCSIAGYRQMCCRSCGANNFSTWSTPSPPSSNISSWTLTTKTGTSASSSTTIISDLLRTSHASFTVTPPPTSGGSTAFVYVDYDDYDEYSTYEDTAETITTSSSPVSISTRHQTRTVPVLTRKTTTPLITVPESTAEDQRSTQAPARTSAIPEYLTTRWADDIITVSSSRGRSHKTKINLTETDPTAAFLFPSLKNKSMDEVSYRIVGLDGDIIRGQQSYFVPRMPPFRERTQNKRIQELLNEKRRQDLLRRSGRGSRTETKHDGL